jgi:signal transduction histidine kinase/CheY-like chemotaxis protein
LPGNSFHNIKKIPVFIIAALAVIISASFFCFKGIRDNQINYIRHILGNQVISTGKSVDNTDESFINDLNQMLYSENVQQFISDADQRTRTIDRMKLFFSKYENLITGIRIYDDKKNEFTLKKDETGNTWLEQLFVLHVQGEIVPYDTLVLQNRTFEYYIPLREGDILAGNIVVTLDYQKYFEKLFCSFNMEDFQWQWVIDDSGEIIFTNSKEAIKYSQLQKIRGRLESGAVADLIHSAGGNSNPGEIISSYYSTGLLQRNFNMVFSSPISEIRTYLLRNFLILVIVAVIALLFVAGLLYRIITAQKVETEKVLSSVEKLQKIYEEMPVGIVIYNNKREILKANKKAAEQYSFQDEKAMQGTMLPVPSITDENNYFARYMGSDFTPDQFVTIKKDNSEAILFLTKMPVKFQDQDATMELLVDVTNLEAARKQEASASSAKSEFLARMSYELRTPLNGIIGMADILERHDLTDESAAVLKILRRSAEVLLGLINDILDFSKIESGKMILDEIPFSLREEVVYCYDLARTNTDGTQIDLSVSIDDNIPDKVIGDPYRIRQILTNFINNSIANTRQGKISLRCTLKENAEGKIRILFLIADTGRAFDQASLRKMFGNHVSMDSKAARENDESGFGLVLARQLIELMGGEFEVKSPSGLDGETGTKIEFTINIWSEEMPQKALNNDSLISFGQIRTLVVTGSQNRDEEMLGTIHKLGLAMTVTTFQKSTVGQIKASLSIPDKKYHLIVILDDFEFNGFEAAACIHEHNLSDQFVIIMISSHDIRGNLVKCSSFGVDHYIVKPYDIKELYGIVKSSFPYVDRTVPADDRDRVNRDLRILVVEDNKMNQKVLGTILKSLGYSFDFADDGFAGLIQAKTRRYDVIFMDLIMPQMDGFEAARRILEYDSTLLIVAFTADNLPDSKRKAELSGIKEFISKPVRIEDLKKFFSRHFFSN